MSYGVLFSVGQPFQMQIGLMEIQCADCTSGFMYH